MFAIGNLANGAKVMKNLGNAGARDDALDRQPTLVERLRSDIAHLEARYDSGAIPPALYAVLQKLRQELSELAIGKREGR